MAQHTSIANNTFPYTRLDYTALRFRLNKLPADYILNNVYSEDTLIERRITSPQSLNDFLDELRDHLVKYASLSNPHLARTLSDARQFNRWSKATIDYLVHAADEDRTRPKVSDAISVWMKPVIAKRLKQEGIVDIAGLRAYITARGVGWYRAVPRIGEGKARALEHWLKQNAGTLGQLEIPTNKIHQNVLPVHPGANYLVPLERISYVAHELDGSKGINRNNAFCMISARNDLEAVQAYLLRFHDRAKTARSYQKELERFLLWCVVVRRVPLSGVLTEDCEAYKTFLEKPLQTWIGPKAPRKSERWRPFVGQLSADSQRYAVMVIRTFFEWLVNVRYLHGNPWITVNDPAVETKLLPMAIDKALPGNLWHRLVDEGGLLDTLCERLPAPESGVRPATKQEVLAVQLRLSRAAVLLIGLTGIRREEAATSQRGQLKRVPALEGVPDGLWELAILGKRKKWRSVFLTTRVIEALKLHWQDRGHDFFGDVRVQSLLSPVVVPKTLSARKRHEADDGQLIGAGFKPDGLYQLVKTTFTRIASDETLDLSAVDRDTLRRAAPHALRHTFATQAIAGKVPNDVVQRIMGHASMNTTSIYVQAEKTRSIEEMAKLFGRT